MKIRVVHGSHGQKKYLDHYLSIKETKKATVLIEENSAFEDAVHKLRKEYGITQEWLIGQEFNWDHEQLYHNNWEEYKIEEFFDKCQELTKVLKLPYYWWYSISTFIAFGYFPTPEVTTLEIVSAEYITVDGVLYNRNLPWVSSILNKGFVVIAIPEKVSKQKLHKLIDAQWGEISKHIEKMSDIPKTNILRPDISRRIVRMKDIHKMTFAHISDCLSKEYSDKEDIFELVSSEDNIKNLYHRWKKIKQGFS